MSQQRHQQQSEFEVNTRIKRALDQASASVMLADSENHIIYMNDAANRLFKEAESDFRAHFGQFDSTSLIGTSMDVFHKNPAHQQRVVGGLSGAHSAEVVVGSKTLALDVVPVVNDQGSASEPQLSGETVATKLRLSARWPRFWITP